MGIQVQYTHVANAKSMWIWQIWASSTTYPTKILKSVTKKGGNGERFFLLSS